jgi:imidazolonepropionase-like amidohydrolase
MQSGYGLSPEAEVRSVRLAAALDEMLEQPTRSTALLAHVVPEGYSADAWMAVVQEMPSVFAAV